MKSWRCQIVPMGRKATTGVTASICTSTMASRDCRNWRCRVQDDTERTVVSIGVDRVDVRHLDDGEQRKQRQAHQRRLQRRLWALRGGRCASMGDVRSNSTSLLRGACNKNTHDWMHQVTRCHSVKRPPK